jgi:prepilin peptidase CpaA
MCAALGAAAVEDVLRLRVSNVIVIVILVAAAAAAGLAGLSLVLWENFIVFLVLLAGGTMLFAAGKVGGGDVKLLAAVGLWMDLERAMILLAAVFVSGGLIALAVLVPRLVRGRTDPTTARGQARGVPYAVAIALGAFIVIGLQR